MSHPKMPPEPASNNSENSVMVRMIQTLTNIVRRMRSRRSVQSSVHIIAPTGSMFTSQREFITRSVFTTVAPCRGDSFTFEISVVLIWKGKGLRSTMMAAIERAGIEHREDIEKRLRELSREFEPDAFAAAEEHMNNELELPLTYEMGLLTCHSSVRVGPDENLCKHLQKQWIDSADDKAQHVRAKRHIEYLTELRELWIEFLDQLDDPRAAQAVQLANKPSLVGDVAAEVTETRQRTMQELQELVDKAIIGHEAIDAYDFVNSCDSALRSVMQQLGMSTPSGNETDSIAA